MAFILGLDGKMYYGDSLIASADEAGVEAVTWTEQGNVRDLTTDLENGSSDVTIRANNGWRQTAVTLTEGELNFEMVWDPDDAGFTALQTAFFDKSEISLMALDGDKDTVGSQGLASNFTIQTFSRNEALEEAMTVTVTAVPSSYTLWYEQTGP